MVHAFWVPVFEFKRDVIPGHPNHFQIYPVKTGTYLGHCTEFCGLWHAYMMFRVRIVTPAQFHAFMHAKQIQQKAVGTQ